MNFRSNVIKDLIDAIKSDLRDFYPANEIRGLINILFDHFYGWSSTQVQMKLDERLDEGEMVRFIKAVKQLKEQVPVQYITGKAWFAGRYFSVTSDTLIPRPETEELCELMISRHSDFSGALLDIGTGSGCIPITLQSAWPNASVSAMDISEKALEVAKRNADQLPIDFFYDSILAPQVVLKTSFDIIVSNPPYVLESDKAQMEKNVLEHEPHTALFVSDHDPLEFYRAILEYAERHLKPEGWIYFEIHYQMGNEIKALFESFKFTKIEVKRDIFDKERMAFAQKLP